MYESYQFYRRRQRRRRIISSAVAAVIIVAVAVTLLTMRGGTPGETDHAGLEGAGNPGEAYGGYSAYGDHEAGLRSETGEPAEPRFSDVYFSIPSNELRYEAFWRRYPDLSMEEVVWMVGSHLDHDFFEVLIETDIDAGLFILVNKFYFVPPGFRPGDLVRGEDGMYMSEPVHTAFLGMRDAVRDEIDGELVVASAFRSVERQEVVFNNFLENHPLEEVLRFSAKPGHSEHHTGLAIDVTVPGGTLGGFIVNAILIQPVIAHVHSLKNS